jgi:hypothetical protein
MVDILSLKNEYKIVKPVETIIAKGLSRKKKNREEPNWAIMHIHMKVPQGNTLC